MQRLEQEEQVLVYLGVQDPLEKPAQIDIVEDMGSVFVLELVDQELPRIVHQKGPKLLKKY